MPITKLWQGMIAVFVAVALIAATKQGISYWLDQHDAALRQQVKLQINDSTKAQSTVAKTSKKDLPALTDAAKTMGGKLVAGTKIVTVPETIYVAVHDAPTVIRDSSRTATMTDTTKGYTVTIQADAPPFPAPLKLGYQIVTPSFTPEVGFVERNGEFFAVVSWADMKFEATKSFYKPPKERPIHVNLGAELQGRPEANVAGAGVQARIWAGAEYAAPNHLSILLNAGNQNGLPFISLGVQKRVW